MSESTPTANRGGRLRGSARGRGGATSTTSNSRRANFGSSLSNGNPNPNSNQVQNQDSNLKSNSNPNSVPPNAPTGPSQSNPTRSRGGGGSSSNRARGSKGKGRANPTNRDSIKGKEITNGNAEGDGEEEEGEAASTSDDQEEVDPDADLCFICAEPVKLYSLAPCDHRTCHVCAVRLRALYKKMECTFCKTPISQLIFTPSPDSTFSSFTPNDIPYSDSKLNISFQTREAMEETLIMLRFNCPEKKCEVASGGWADLKMHVKRVHQRSLCDLCVSQKKIFSHEHTLYTNSTLTSHMESEHGFCEYCRSHHYSDDELFSHMRDRHEQCHICKNSNPDSNEERWKYFKDYNMLERHFKSQHFACTDKECLEKKFVVFASLVDLKSHLVEVHGEGLSNREKKDALRIEGNFTYGNGNETNTSGNNGGGGGSGGVRGARRPAARQREENNDILAPGGLAHRDRSQIPGAGPKNAPNASRKAQFGGQLTGSTSTSNSNEPSTSSSGNGSQNDPQTAERHSVYLAKVSSILNSDSKLTSFRSAVKTYRSSEMSGKDLVHTIFSLVGGEVDKCSFAVNGLVDLLEEEEKKRDVLQAWNSLRAERTHFPSLVPMSADSDRRYANLAGGQIRTVKSTTSRGDDIWASVERAAQNGTSAGSRAYAGSSRGTVSRDHFPALGGSAGGSSSIPGSVVHSRNAVSQLRSVGGSTTPWSSSSSSSSRTTPSTQSGSSTPKPQPFSVQVSTTSSKVSGSNRAPPKPTESAFPSLPTNAKRAALQSYKREVLARPHAKNGRVDSSSHSASGGNTPTSWGVTADNYPLMSPPIGSSSSNGPNPDELSRSLLETTMNDTNGSGSNSTAPQGGGKKKKNKGILLASMGGVQRGA